MEPTLVDGDRLLVHHFGRPQPGVIAVVALPSGVLAVKRLTFRDESGWWVERDNPTEGVDSWTVGAIAAEDVRAIAICLVWPPRSLLRWLRRRRGLSRR